MPIQNCVAYLWINLPHSRYPCLVYLDHLKLCPQDIRLPQALLRNPTPPPPSAPPVPLYNLAGTSSNLRFSFSPSHYPRCNHHPQLSTSWIQVGFIQRGQCNIASCNVVIQYRKYITLRVVVGVLDSPLTFFSPFSPFSPLLVCYITSEVVYHQPGRGSYIPPHYLFQFLLLIFRYNCTLFMIGDIEYLSVVKACRLNIYIYIFSCKAQTNVMSLLGYMRPQSTFLNRKVLNRKVLFA